TECSEIDPPTPHAPNPSVPRHTLQIHAVIRGAPEDAPTKLIAPKVAIRGPSIIRCPTNKALSALDLDLPNPRQFREFENPHALNRFLLLQVLKAQERLIRKVLLARQNPQHRRFPNTLRPFKHYRTIEFTPWPSRSTPPSNHPLPSDRAIKRSGLRATEPTQPLIQPRHSIPAYPRQIITDRIEPNLFACSFRGVINILGFRIKPKLQNDYLAKRTYQCIGQRGSSGLQNVPFNQFLIVKNIVTAADTKFQQRESCIPISRFNLAVLVSVEINRRQQRRFL